MIDFVVGFVVFDVMLDSNQKHVNLFFTRGKHKMSAV